MHLIPDVVVMGDINLDWVVRENLPFRFADLTANGVIVWSPIQELAGGSGLLFAAHARRRGYRPLLLGRVGADASGRTVAEYLAESGIEPALTVDPSHNTGKAFIVRDLSDVRFLVNDGDNANAHLCVGDVERHRDAIASCRVLYVSGYCVKNRQAPRYEAAVRAMTLARGGDQPRPPVVVFDVVPHRIYETYSFAEFRETTRHVDILISEVPTVRRFLGLGSRSEVVDHALAAEAASLLRPYYTRFILRYGPSGCDEQLLWDGTAGRMERQATGHAEAAEKRGLGDFLTVRELGAFFGIEPTPP
jgi:sugar/nucleoside kinase (ribokinase family)